jgi:hypothetical protein
MGNRRLKTKRSAIACLLSHSVLKCATRKDRREDSCGEVHNDESYAGAYRISQKVLTISALDFAGTPLFTDLVELRFLGFFTCLRWRRLRQPLINYLKYLWVLDLGYV